MTTERDALLEALKLLVESATAEANEKGLGGYHGARLTDARNLIKEIESTNKSEETSVAGEPTAEYMAEATNYAARVIKPAEDIARDFWDMVLAHAPPKPAPEQQDDGCICKGNWRLIIKETQHLFGKQFRDSNGDEFTFYGVVHSDDDYYYGMSGKSGGRMLSCVGDLDGHGFELVPSPSQPKEGTK